MKTRNFCSIGFFLVVASVGFFLMGCATNPSVTQELFNDLRKYDEEHAVPAPGTFASFRFYISKDVVLTRVERELNVNKSAPVVRRSTERNIVNLKSSTTGRVQGNPTARRLEIAFEVLKDGPMPTFTFVQKPETGTDLYYFELDSDGFIPYDGERYNVTYKKNRRSMNDEPFLLYVETSKEKTRSRTMKGLR